jgi:hypothetical protein
MTINHDPDGFESDPFLSIVELMFNGKPQASLPEFAYACGSPLNENAL